MLRLVAIVAILLAFSPSLRSQDHKSGLKAAKEQAQEKAKKAEEYLKAAEDRVKELKARQSTQHDGHDHSGHSGHDHSQHDHSGHNHSDHSGHDHGKQKKQKKAVHQGHDHNQGTNRAHDHGSKQGHNDHGIHNKDNQGNEHEHKSGHVHGAKGHNDGHHHANDYSKGDCGVPAQPIHHEGYDPTATAIHHISDANVWTIMDMVRIPLPAIIHNKERGMEFFSTGKFKAGHHDNGDYGYKDYVLFEGNIHRITCPDFKAEERFAVEGYDLVTLKDGKGKEYDKRYAVVNGKAYRIEQKTILDGGILGGGITGFTDFSPTKNVVSMGLVSMLLFFLFRKAVKGYKGDPSAPSGIQSFLEPMFQFIRDDVAIPFLGDKHEKFLPLLMTIFFFILGLNLWGQVPFLGNVNVTGSLTVTAIMAIIVFILTNINGNGDYWKHILWPPDTPLFVKIILIPVEILGLFIKPITLMLRLAGNITAGHIAILSFVGLIFIFGKAGTNMAGSLTGTALAIPLTMFMMAIELIVAFVQAFVFAILTASYLGAATEEHHHDDHH